MTALTKRGLPRKRVAAGASAADRILLHTDRSGDCWLWTAATDDNGYGRLTLWGSTLYAHRVSYQAFVGEIPDGKQLDHLCRVRECCNPHHLEPVTPQVNMLRGESPGAKAQRRDLCLYGHPYEEHAFIRRDGRRICHLCQLTYMRLWQSVPLAEASRRKAAGLPVVDLGAYWMAQRVEERAA